jgi:hypothetical protein
MTSTSEIYLYPRLPRSAARSILSMHAPLGLDDLRATGSLSHLQAAPSATGGTPVSAQTLAKLQSGFRQIEDQFGFPELLSLPSQQALDHACGTFLLRSMNIVPADAAEEGVWSFLSLVVLPEFAPWRFPSRTEERLIGRPRNALRRLWWRAWTLGPDLAWAPEGCTPLFEDESVQLMERSTVSKNRRTAKAVQNALWRAEKAGITLSRTDLVRLLIPRVRAARSNTCLDALTDESLDELLDGLLDQVLEISGELRKAPARRAASRSTEDDSHLYADELAPDDLRTPAEDTSRFGGRMLRYLTPGRR